GAHETGVFKDYNGDVGAKLMLDVRKDQHGAISRYWYHRYSIAGQDARTRIGEWPAMSLTAAREEAVRREGQAKAKIDPRWGVAGTGKSAKFVAYLDSIIALETPDSKGTWADILNPNDRSEWKRTRALTEKIHGIDVHEVTADHVERCLLA